MKMKMLLMKVMLPHTPLQQHQSPLLMPLWVKTRMEVCRSAAPYMISTRVQGKWWHPLVVHAKNKIRIFKSSKVSTSEEEKSRGERLCVPPPHKHNRNLHMCMQMEYEFTCFLLLFSCCIYVEIAYNCFGGCMRFAQLRAHG